MKHLSTLPATLLALLLAASTAHATSISGVVAADNYVELYLSTDDAVLGTFIGSGTLVTPLPLGPVGLTPGMTNYLHVRAINAGTPPSDPYMMFVGEFSLSDAGFTFANGTQSLLTNTIDWRAGGRTLFTDGGAYPHNWYAPAATPFTWGPNGSCCAWFYIGTMVGADFLWAPPPGALDTLQGTAFLSTPIFPNATAVPLPPSGPMTLSGLVSLAYWLRHRRRPKT